MPVPKVRPRAIAVLAIPLAAAFGCASGAAAPARTAGSTRPSARADQLQARTPEQIAGTPRLAPEPLRPVSVPLDSAVVGSRPARRR